MFCRYNIDSIAADLWGELAGMTPGVNPRQMRKMMQRMGIQQQEIPAKRVVIHMHDKEIVIIEPSVVKVNMMGQETFQISGKISERDLESSEEDIRTVMEQAKVDREAAVRSLQKTDGDLAKAIMDLQVG
ncbi:MAG: nascent polypeptide-associated complex protein [Candidatus Woesearchaeota archaeon]